MCGMARACGRTIQIIGLAFHIRIVRLPTELDIGCRLGVLQDVLLVSVRYLGILAVDAPEPPANRIVQAVGDLERLLVSQIVPEMDSREFFPCRIDRETGDLEHLGNQTVPEGREGNLGDPPPDLATRVLGRGRRTGPRSTGYKRVRETAHRSNATGVTRVLAIARSRVLRLLGS